MGQYEIVIAQQPIRARMCGFGEKDRRPVDPPPIIQLTNLSKDVKQDFLKVQNYVVHCDLYQNELPCSKISTPNSQLVRNLVGSLVVSPTLLYNEFDVQGIYFLFSDLSVRTEGEFKLKFSLFEIEDDQVNIPVSSVVFSGTFSVYPPKKFPGMTDSTNLSKAFSKQGIKIAIRKNERNGACHDTIEEEESLNININ